MAGGNVRTLHSHIITFLIKRFDDDYGIFGQTQLLLDRVGGSHGDNFVLLLRLRIKLELGRLVLGLG